MSESSRRSLEETSVFVPLGADHMFGVLTHPMGGTRGIAVLFLWGSAGFPSFGKNMMLARLARQAAESDYHALRFDYLGCGDSSGSVTNHQLSTPVIREAEAACQWLRGRGLSNVILVGSCSGARIALAAADQLPGVAGLAMLSPPVMDYTREETLAIRQAMERKASPEWASTTFLEPLRRVVDKGVPVLMVYGTADKLYKEFARARSGRLGHLLQQTAQQAQVKLIDGWVHADPSIEGQDRVVDILDSWFVNLNSRVPV